MPKKHQKAAPSQTVWVGFTFDIGRLECVYLFSESFKKVCSPNNIALTRILKKITFFHFFHKKIKIFRKHSRQKCSILCSEVTDKVFPPNSGTQDDQNCQKLRR